MTLSPRQHRLEDALRHLLLEKPDEELSEDAIARLALSSEPDVLVDRAPSDRLQKERPPLVRRPRIRRVAACLAWRSWLLWASSELVDRDIFCQRVFASVRR